MHPVGSTEGIPFGRYRIRRRLGSGGMGEVFLADQLGPLGPVRPVALKRMRPSLAQDAPLARRFLQEMGIAARLNHPHIAVTHDFGEVDGVYFMAMEYIDGASLDRILAAGALPVAPALLVAQRIADALAFAHDRNPPVVHQDVSPQNVMIDTSGQIKLLDFGIAAAEAAAQELLRAKAPYAAPEQLRGKPPERRFDLWALGVLLYEMLTGRRPFPGPSASDVLHQIQRGAVLPVEALNPNAAAASSLIRQALNPVPERRWRSARAFADACTVLLARREPAARDALIVRIPQPKSDPGHVVATTTAARPTPRLAPDAGDANDTAERRGETGRAHDLVDRRRRRVGLWPVSLAAAALPVTIAGFTWWASHEGAAPLAASNDGRSAVKASPAIEAPRDNAAGEGAKGRSAGSNADFETVPRAGALGRDSAATSIAPKQTKRLSSSAKTTEKRRPADTPRTRRRRKGKSQSQPDKTGRSSRPSVAASPTAPPAEARARPGRLSVRSTPWARVHLDGQLLGEGIIAARRVPAGRHTLRLFPGEGEYAPRSIEIEIESDRVTKVFADFARNQIRVEPAR